MIITKKQKKDFNAVANFRDKNEKASWLRKKKNLEALVDRLAPIESQLLVLNAKKLDIMDDINGVRKTMIIDCIHPQDYLVHYESYIKCRFCESNISIPRNI